MVSAFKLFVVRINRF